MDRQEHGRRLLAVVTVRMHDLELDQADVVSALGVSAARLRRWFSGESVMTTEHAIVLGRVLRIDYRFITEPPPVVPLDGKWPTV